MDFNSRFPVPLVHIKPESPANRKSLPGQQLGTGEFRLERSVLRIWLIAGEPILGVAGWARLRRVLYFS